MKFTCCHDALFGVGGLCFDCYKKKMAEPKNPKVKKWMPKEYHRDYRKRNEAKLRAYYRDFKRAHHNVIVGEYVVYDESTGKFFRRAKTGKRWDSFALAHVYKTKRFAENACKLRGFGVPLKRMETEAKTLQNYRAEMEKGK